LKFRATNCYGVFVSTWRFILHSNIRINDMLRESARKICMSQNRREKQKPRTLDSFVVLEFTVVTLGAVGISSSIIPRA
jgi:hypothetical protein